MSARGAGLLIVGVGLAAFVFFLMRQGEEQPGAAPPRQAPATSAATTPGDGNTPPVAQPAATPTAAAPGEAVRPPAQPATRAAARTALDAALREQAEAEAALRTAELDLDELEDEIEAVERYVDALDAAGEDPARHAFEGMERLDPVIERFEARMAVVEAADARVAAANRSVEDARAALSTFDAGR